MNLFFSKNALLAGLCIVALSGYSSSLYAGNSNSPEPTAVQQTKKITGTVSDAMGPVIGASVVIKGTTNGVATDYDGNFTLNASQGQTLVISYIGYITKGWIVSMVSLLTDGAIQLLLSKVMVCQ